MHGHTTELVTNLLLPGMYDVRSVARSKTGSYPLNSIDIIDGDDYDRHECVNRLRSAMQHPDLDQLVLSEIEMDENVIISLLDLLRSGRKWQAIYLEFCEGDLARTIDSVLTLSNVCKIEIAGNLTQSCIRTLSAALSKNASLVELALLVRMNEENADILINGLAQSRGLRKLRFVKSTLEPSSISSLARFLRSDNRFETIHFDRCIVADNDIAALVHALEDHSTLKELCIGANLCDTFLHCALSNILSRNRLRHLSLRSSIQPSQDFSLETGWMMRALQANNSLRVLDLSDNCLDDVGLGNLVEAFCTNVSLEEARLHENRITNNGAKLLGERLPEMTGIKRIFLHRNRFDEKGAEAILNGVRRNDAIEEVTIPTMGRNMKMSRYQRLISYETCLNSGGKKVLKDRQFPLNLLPLVLERSGQHLWTPYCEYQMQSTKKWKEMQQADVNFHLIQSVRVCGYSS
jgi:Ran GTPase-activating protein (RanGAP) involved in mRNA processing and transport